jgi:o-succinylbenzoate synthase
MSLQAELIKHVFAFNFRARTSRGVMQQRTSWFVKLWEESNPTVFGIGECAPLPGLSVDDRSDYESVLTETLQSIQLKNYVPVSHGHALSIPSLKNIVPAGFPSITFGLETALMDLANGGKRMIINNDFMAGRQLPINGLIWMADMDLMLQQIAIKVQEGYTCIKMKVGGLNFEKECDILHYVRKKYYRENLTVRLDANGAFKNDDCLLKLKELSKFDIHSIEQPIKPGQPDVMEEICAKSAIPVALDEELIGVEEYSKKEKLLDKIKPPYIILKPSLHGGLASCQEWIALAGQKSIGWWMTSALESNIGLNAICQFTASFPTTIPQGLGTGQLYEDNIPSPLLVRGGKIGVNSLHEWDLSLLPFGSK